jgi:type IV pilus assembly protein PilB
MHTQAQWVPDNHQLNTRLERILLRDEIIKKTRKLSELNSERIYTDVLIEQGRLSQESANVILSEACGVHALDPSYITCSPAFLSHLATLIDKKFAMERQVFGIKQENVVFHLVMANPLDSETIREVEALTGSRLHVYCCHSVGILETIKNHYPEPGSTQSKKTSSLIEQAVQHINRLQNSSIDDPTVFRNNAHVIQLLQHILQEQIKAGASDIHFEPLDTELRVRSRLDGVLHTHLSLPKRLYDSLIPRIKMMADMDISQTSIPLDGKISQTIAKEHIIDVRVSSLPTIHGEKIVLRILNKGSKGLRLQDLSFNERDNDIVRNAITRPNGMILATGPTGSGKTTTLYAILQELNREDVNICTVEDPVEYELHGITQVSCSEKSDNTFARSLKAFLRQDPDIIMVGEIRDLETADIAVKAAMTGHLVLSTLHTNDAVSSITRFINIGVPPYLVSACGMTVLAQRLVRTVCPACQKTFKPDCDILRALGIEKKEIEYVQGKGCDQCANTGYAGRAAIYEILHVSDEIETMIYEKCSAKMIRETAMKEGMATLRQAALHRLFAGETTPAEVLRVTMDV